MTTENIIHEGITSLIETENQNVPCPIADFSHDRIRCVTTGYVPNVLEVPEDMIKKLSDALLSSSQEEPDNNAPV